MYSYKEDILIKRVADQNHPKKVEKKRKELNERTPDMSPQTLSIQGIHRQQHNMWLIDEG